MNHIGTISSVSPHLRLARCAVVVFAASIGVILSGCGKRAVEVDVFIVTKGSQNVKLGLVEVSATKMESVKESLTPISRERSEKIQSSKKVLAESEEKLARTQQSFDDSEKMRSEKMFAAFESQHKYSAVWESASNAVEAHMEKVEAQLAASLNASLAAFEKKMAFEKALAMKQLAPNAGWKDENKIIAEIATFREILGREVWKGLPAQRDSLLAELPQYEAATRVMFAAERAKEKINGEREQLLALVASSRASHVLLGKPDELFDNLPQAEVVAKTNADGKCTLTLPKGGNWVVTARSRRTVTNDNEETYDWLVQIPQNATHIMLSNDNVLNPLEDPLARLK